MLAQVAGDACLHRRAQHRLFLIAGQDHDLGLGPLLLDGRRRLDPRAIRHVHVEQDHVRLERPRPVDRLLDGSTLAHHLHPRLGPENGG